jgi:hypothetical protein
MSRTIVVFMCATLLAPALVRAQDGDAQKQPRPTNTSPERAVPRPTPSTVNVEVELTINDSIGSTPAQKKTVSITIADGRMGRVRSVRGAPNLAILNVDATPILLANDRIRLELTLEYSPPQGEQQGSSKLSVINELVTVLLQSGKPMTISQAADPANDRRVAVDVTATILK